MSLHRTELIFMGCRIWMEPEEKPQVPGRPEVLQWQAEHSASALRRLIMSLGASVDTRALLEMKP